jgi:hypothetical protein
MGFMTLGFVVGEDGERRIAHETTRPTKKGRAIYKAFRKRTLHRRLARLLAGLGSH